MYQKNGEVGCDANTPIFSRPADTTTRRHVTEGITISHLPLARLDKIQIATEELLHTLVKEALKSLVSATCDTV